MTSLISWKFPHPSDKVLVLSSHLLCQKSQSFSAFLATAVIFLSVYVGSGLTAVHADPLCHFLSCRTAKVFSRPLLSFRLSHANLRSVCSLYPSSVYLILFLPCLKFVLLKETFTKKWSVALHFFPNTKANANTKYHLIKNTVKTAILWKNITI